ncbi:hypothetical protein [Rhodovulum bhavnagarense]|uniref:hypothetical protein n=1 Tax=Rhodovulum bhavnagarense TaxID=992286 RepID=UPI001FB80C65|nr:hypothetical protein [Rhodovulum bhavnagarense]
MNPVDVAGGTDADPGLFATCAEVILQDAGVDLLLTVGMFGGYAERFDTSLGKAEQAAARRLADIAAKTGRPLIVHSVYAGLGTAPLILHAERGATTHQIAAWSGHESLKEVERYTKRVNRRRLLTPSPSVLETGEFF